MYTEPVYVKLTEKHRAESMKDYRTRVGMNLI